MIFVDSEKDLAALDVIRRFPALRVLHRVRSSELSEEQKQRCPSFAKLEGFVNEVSARQLLDAELAMAKAPELGCRWLVCLDSDELFYTKEASVVPHFQYLEEKGIQQMSYLNHEPWHIYLIERGQNMFLQSIFFDKDSVYKTTHTHIYIYLIIYTYGSYGLDVSYWLNKNI